MEEFTYVAPHANQTCGPIGEMSITLAPLERKGPAENCLGRLSSAARIFLQQEHPQLLDQLSELSMCPQCQEKGGGKLMRPGSFSTAELTLAEKSKGFIKVSSWYLFMGIFVICIAGFHFTWWRLFERKTMYLVRE